MLGFLRRGVYGASRAAQLQGIPGGAQQARSREEAVILSRVLGLWAARAPPALDMMPQRVCAGNCTPRSGRFGVRVLRAHAGAVRP